MIGVAGPTQAVTVLGLIVLWIMGLYIVLALLCALAYLLGASDESAWFLQYVVTTFCASAGALCC